MFRQKPFAYISNSLDDTVSVINTATNTVVDTVDVGNEPEGYKIYSFGDI